MSTTINYAAMVAAIRSRFPRPDVCKIILTPNLIEREGWRRNISLSITSASSGNCENFMLLSLFDFHLFADLQVGKTIREEVGPSEKYIAALERELNKHLEPLHVEIKLPPDQVVQAGLEKVTLSNVAELGNIAITLVVTVAAAQYTAYVSPKNSVPLDCLFTPASLKYIYDSGVPSSGTGFRELF